MNCNICYSGGAGGADDAFGKIAAAHGHLAIHYTFSGHGLKAKKGDNIIHHKLTPDELMMADTYLAKANNTLKRRFPSNSAYTDNLLRRNWWQQRETHTIYAVGEIDWNKQQIKGGTAWACQCMIDRLSPAPVFNTDFVYVYDQSASLWYYWDILKESGPTFSEISFDDVRKPSGHYTGIGTRTLKPNGEAAIKGLFA